MAHEIQISWRALEYPYKEKTPDWYAALTIIIIALVVMSFLLGNILFGILMIIGGGTLMLYGARKPQMLEVSITNRGIAINNTLYLFHDLESFWIDEDSPEQKILLQSHKALSPYISIPIGDTDADEIRIILEKFIEEVEQGEPITQKLIDYLGF